MVFFWFLIGAIVGAAIAWYFLNQKCASDLAERDRQISELKNKHSAQKPAKAPQSEAQPQAVSAISQSKSTQDDDLTRIKGVGKVLNGKLNELGIRSFEQIASFTRADIDRVNEQLSFKGRIEREEWVQQAKALTK